MHNTRDIKSHRILRPHPLQPSSAPMTYVPEITGHARYILLQTCSPDPLSIDRGKVHRNYFSAHSRNQQCCLATRPSMATTELPSDSPSRLATFFDWTITPISWWCFDASTFQPSFQSLTLIYLCISLQSAFFCPIRARRL